MTASTRSASLVERQNGIMTIDVPETHLLAQAADRPALEREAVAVARRVVARGAAEAEHRILLLGLERGAADQIRVFVGLEVAHAHDDRLRIVGSRDAGEAAGQAVDEILGLVVVALGQFGDRALGILVLERVVVHQRHRMHLDVVADHEFHAREADAVGRNPPPAEGGRRVGEVEHDLGARRRNVARGRAPPLRSRRVPS